MTARRFRPELLGTMKWLKDIISLHSLPGKAILWLYLVSLVPFITPPDWLRHFLVEDFIRAYKLYVGIPCVVLTPLVFINAVYWLYTKVQGPVLQRRLRNEVGRLVSQLDPQEAAVIREFKIQGNSVMMPIDDPVVAGLIRKGLMQRVSSTGRISLAGSTFPVAISPEVLEAIKFEQVGMPNREMTEKERQWLQSNRPRWVGTLARENAMFNQFL